MHNLKKKQKFVVGEEKRRKKKEGKVKKGYLDINKEWT
jgi:hypothetical protein